MLLASTMPLASTVLGTQAWVAINLIVLDVIVALLVLRNWPR